MIAKGKIRGQGGKLARYLMTGEPGETAQLVEARGLAEFGPDPVTAFNNLEKWAEANTKSTKAFFHGHIRLAPGEKLTDAQWMRAVDRKEKALGYSGQPRMVSFHIDPATGEKHVHVAWFRIDLETDRAIDPGLYKNKLKKLSRELEKEFGLRIVSNERKPEHRARAADRNEFEEGRRLGTDTNAIRTAILDCFEKSDGGRAFDAAIRERGGIVANGDRGFVVIDPAGGHHALNKKLTGMTLAAIRERLADLELHTLPTVDQAKQMQIDRAVTRATAEAQHVAAAPSQPHLEYQSGLDRYEPGRRKQRQPENEDMDEDLGLKQRQQRQEIEDREAGGFNDMVAERNRADRFIQEWQIDHDTGARNKRHLQEAQWQREAEGDIVDVRHRALIAAGESRDFVQAVRREGAMITQEHAELQRKIALEEDPDKKHLLELKRDIQHADYMALANERITAFSGLNSEQYRDAQRQQEVWEKAGTGLRAERLELQGRMADQEMQHIDDAVQKMNEADRNRAEHRADIGGPVTQDNQPAPQTSREPVEQQYAAAAPTAPFEATTPASEAEQPRGTAYQGEVLQPGAHVQINLSTGQAEIIHSSPSRPAAEAEASTTTEQTDARQVESTTAEHTEITDAKAAKKAALAAHRTEIEQGIAQGRERGFENSR